MKKGMLVTLAFALFLFGRFVSAQTSVVNGAKTLLDDIAIYSDSQAKIAKAGPEDAKVLQAKIDGARTAIMKVLRQYSSSPSDTKLTLLDLAKKFQDNPFIGAGLKEKFQGDTAESKTAGAETESRSLIPGTSLSVSAVAEGLARFMIKRARLEAGEYALNQYSVAIRSYPEARLLLPASDAYLSDILSKGDFENMLPALPRAFQGDFENLPTRFLLLNTVQADEKASAAVKEAVQKRAALYKKMLIGDRGLLANLLSRVASGLIRGEDAISLLRDIDEIAKNYKGEGVSEESRVAAAALHFLRIVVESFMSDTAGRLWVDRETALATLRDPDGFTYYLGLLYASMKKDDIDIDAEGKDTLSGLMAANAKSIKGTAIAFSKVAIGLEAIDDANRAWREAGGDSSKKAAASSAYFRALGSIVGQVRLEEFGAWPQDSPASKTMTVMRETLSLGIGFAGAVSANDYVAVLSYFLSFLEQVEKSLPEKEYADVKKVLGEVRESLRKFSGFASALASAKDASEIESVIEAYAAGKTSYTIKYKKGFSIALDSFLGGDFATNFDDATNWGVYAPVGLSFNWRLCPEKRKWSLGFFLGLVDLGAVAQYRYSDETLSMPDLELKDLFSLSGSLILGIGDSPLSIGAGGRFGPALAKIRESSGAEYSETPIQGFAFIALDIPLLGIYGK
jgi:hypothetical protein